MTFLRYKSDIIQQDKKEKEILFMAALVDLEWNIFFVALWLFLLEKFINQFWKVESNPVWYYKV